MDAAVFIVMHLSGTSISDFLMRHPNLHLLVKRNKIILRWGPGEIAPPDVIIESQIAERVVVDY